MISDLAECQGDDCQIVTAQFQYRNTDQPADQGSRDGTGNDADDKTHHITDTGRDENSRYDNSGKGTDTHEACLAEIQFAGNTDIEVQTESSHDIGCDRHQKRHEQTAQLTGSHQSLKNDIGSDHDRKRNRAAAYFFIK